jgi:hypothetical protein
MIGGDVKNRSVECYYHQTRQSTVHWSIAVAPLPRPATPAWAQAHLPFSPRHRQDLAGADGEARLIGERVAFCLDDQPVMDILYRFPVT